MRGTFMKTGSKIAGFLAIVAFLCMAMASTAVARETITFTKANGGEYTILAYKTTTRTYYTLQGKISSDYFHVRVPMGYGSIVNVALGRAVGSRNLYAKRDPMNPIIEVRKISTFVLDLERIGTTPVQERGAGTKEPFKRHPPQ